jgi:nitrite reductase/ring-hydroxylating ferredoxin subunit
MPESSKSRREFLCQATGCFTFALVASGVSREVFASPVRTIEGVRSAPGEKSYPIPPADGVSIDRVEQVILVRYQNKVMAFALSCPHENAAVKWIERDGRFACTKHDSKYQPDGTYTSGRATRNMDRLPIKKAGDTVVVDLDKAYHSDIDAAAWAGAVVTVPVPSASDRES